MTQGVVVAALRAEWRRVVSTRLWWALLIPVVVLALLVNLFGGLLGDGLGDAGDLPVLPASIAFTLTLTAVFAAVYGTVAAAGEFRHRTVTTAYLTAGGRGRVLVGKLVAGSAVTATTAYSAPTHPPATSLPTSTRPRPPAVR